MATNNSTIQDETATMDLEYVEFRITRITLYVSILVLSCVGNSLVAIVIVKARRLRASSNLLILNLAFCDFITPALSIPFDLALEESNYIWSFGRSMCKTLWPFQTVFSTSSTLTLVVISLDRFRILVKPFTGHTSISKIVMFVLIIHAFSIGLCVPYFIALDYNVSEMSCSESWPRVHYRQAYTIVLFLCQYALPLITMIIAYILIYHSLHSNLTRLLSVGPKHRDRSHSRTSTLSKDSMEFKRREQNVRLAKMFVIVVVVFAISMFPNQVLWLWVDFGNGAGHKYFHYISVICRICTYANSVLNPFIYALKSREFRSGFARIGRTTVMQPLTKISSETRKYVRKVSRNVLDSERPSIVHKKPSICRVDTSDDSETFDVSSPTELSPLRGAKIRFTFERKPPVPRRKFSCYEMEDVKELCGVKNDFSSEAPTQNGSVIRYNTQERKDIVVSKCVNRIGFLHNRPSEFSDNINADKCILETPFSGSSYRFFAELRETDC